MPPTIRSRLAGAFDAALRGDAAPPDLAADATTTTTAESSSAAALTNLVSGLGGANDSGQAARPNVSRRYLTPAELLAAYRGTIYRRICDKPAADATRKGWLVSDDSDDTAPFRDDERRLRLRARVREAAAMGRALGEARLWLITDDPGELDEPLVPGEVKALQNLIVLDRNDFSPAEYDNDLTSPTFGQPLRYHVHPVRPGVVTPLTTVHASRLLRFHGDELPPSELGSSQGFADAIGQTVWDRVRNYEGIGAAGAKVAQELSVGVFQMAGADRRAIGGQASGFLARMAAINVSKSLSNAILLMGGESYTRVATPVTGFKELSEDARVALAAILGWPQVVLYGDTPGGLSSDGESHRKIWSALVGSFQEDRLRSPLETIYQILYLIRDGKEPEHWQLVFLPLDEENRKEKAEVRKLTADTDKVYIDAGVLDPDHVARSRFGPEGYADELLPVEEGDDDKTEKEIAAARAEADALRLQRMLRGARAADLGLIDHSDRDADDYAIPKGAQGNAQQVLDWREEHGAAVKGMTSTGWARARQLAAGGRISLSELVTIAAWFARHAGNEAVSEEHEETPWRDAGYVAHLGWGGDTMKTFSTDVVKRAREREEGDGARRAGGLSQITINTSVVDPDATARLSRIIRAADDALATYIDYDALTTYIGYDASPGSICLLIPLPEAAITGWRAAKADAEEALGEPLGGEDFPHVTLLYLGKIEPGVAVEMALAAREVLAGMDPAMIQGGRLDFFPSGADGTPIVIRYRTRALAQLHDALLRKLAPYIKAKQFPRFLAHATLGYLPRDLTDDEAEALTMLRAPGRWSADVVELRDGDVVVATLPIGG